VKKKQKFVVIHRIRVEEEEEEEEKEEGKKAHTYSLTKCVR
jgi:hypothetical protein